MVQAAALARPKPVRIERGAGMVLFVEDFDAPPEPPAAQEPPAVATIDPEAIAAAREEGFAEGVQAGLSQAARERAEVTRQALVRITEQLTAASAEAHAEAEESANALARCIFAALDAVLPATFARHGVAEITAVAQAVLPDLTREPVISIRVNPPLAGAVKESLAGLEKELERSVRIVPTDAIAPGDVRICWEDGAAVRDAGKAWRRILDILAPLGLVSADPAAHSP